MGNWVMTIQLIKQNGERTGGTYTRSEPGSWVCLTLDTLGTMRSVSIVEATQKGVFCSHYKLCKGLLRCALAFAQGRVYRSSPPIYHWTTAHCNTIEAREARTKRRRGGGTCYKSFFTLGGPSRLVLSLSLFKCPHHAKRRCMNDTIKRAEPWSPSRPMRNAMLQRQRRLLVANTLLGPKKCVEGWISDRI